MLSPVQLRFIKYAKQSIYAQNDSLMPMVIKMGESLK